MIITLPARHRTGTCAILRFYYFYQCRDTAERELRLHASAEQPPGPQQTKGRHPFPGEPDSRSSAVFSFSQLEPDLADTPARVSRKTSRSNAIMLSSRLQKLARNTVVAALSALLLWAAYTHYHYDQYYRSSGDRALNQMNLSRSPLRLSF